MDDSTGKICRRKFTNRQKALLYIRAGGKCQSCGVPLGRGWHADHHMPFSHGGATLVANGRAKCPTCNLKDGNRLPDEHGIK